MQDNSQHYHIRMKCEMNFGSQIVHKIGEFHNGIKEQPKRLQSDEENGKLSERHPRPKSLLLW
jgi:hypothetical protein